MIFTVTRLELLTQFAEHVVKLPIGALVSAPFFLLSARILSLRPLSFGAAFLFGLIVGAALLVVSLFDWLLMPDTNIYVEAVISIALSLGTSTALAGYLVRSAEGHSIGFRKGLYFSLVAEGLFGVVLLAIAVVIVAVRYGSKI